MERIKLVQGQGGFKLLFPLSFINSFHWHYVKKKMTTNVKEVMRADKSPHVSRNY